MDSARRVITLLMTCLLTVAVTGCKSDDKAPQSGLVGKWREVARPTFGGPGGNHSTTMIFDVAFASDGTMRSQLNPGDWKGLGVEHCEGRYEFDGHILKRSPPACRRCFEGTCVETSTSGSLWFGDILEESVTFKNANTIEIGNGLKPRTLKRQ